MRGRNRHCRIFRRQPTVLANLRGTYELSITELESAATIRARVQSLAAA